MKRKLVKQGNNALTVTLPAEWIKKFNLKAGNEIEIEEKDKSVIITAEKKEEYEKVEINIPSIDKFMRRLIHEWYILGYDELKVNFNDAETIELIHNIVEELLGFEIVEQGTNYCIIKNVSKALESEFEVLLKRIFLVIISMGEDILNCLKGKKFDKLPQIASVEKITNKHAFFCERLLVKNGYRDFKKTPLIFSIVWSLEQIADEYRDICRSLNVKKIKISDENLKLFQRTNELFKLFYECFYKHDTEQLVKLRREQEILYKDLLNFFEKKKIDNVTAHYLLKICDKLDHIGQLIVA